MIEVVPIGRVQPSTYNPRKADERRLDVVELSLRKLGWLLPVYANRGGEITSGHQRHYVAMRMGLAVVPVEYIEDCDLATRKALNIVFNRGTNDLRPGTTPKDLTDALNRSNVYALADALPDIPRDADAFMRCARAATVPVDTMCKANAGRWVPYARNISRTLRVHGIVMPIIATRDNVIVNGIGRLEMLAEKKIETAKVVYIEDHERDFANAVLNLLSMDFDIHTRYDDVLRYNSFRRARRVRFELGRGFTFAAFGSTLCKDIDIKNAETQKRWAAVYGRVVLDFGAGHLHETEMLRDAGMDVTPFEPYRVTKGDAIDKEESLALTREFLRVVATGKQWSSIFISSVLNSVPFLQDRQHIIRIVSALCGKTTKVYVAASSRKETGWTNFEREFLNESSSRLVQFKLDYEPGIALGDISKVPKVQKYHSTHELYELMKSGFETVKVIPQDVSVYAIACQARPVDPDELRKALQFEFELPYPDDSTMGLSSDARAAFSQRLGIAL